MVNGYYLNRAKMCHELTIVADVKSAGDSNWKLEVGTNLVRSIKYGLKYVATMCSKCTDDDHSLCVLLGDVPDKYKSKNWFKVLEGNQCKLCDFDLAQTKRVTEMLSSTTIDLCMNAVKEMLSDIPMLPSRDAVEEIIAQHYHGAYDPEFYDMIYWALPDGCNASHNTLEEAIKKKLSELEEAQIYG